MVHRVYRLYRLYRAYRVLGLGFGARPSDYKLLFVTSLQAFEVGFTGFTGFTGFRPPGRCRRRPAHPAESSDGEVAHEPAVGGHNLSRR